MPRRRAAYRRGFIERELIDGVRRVRESGASWARSGNERGTTGEAARQRYARKISA